MKKQLLIALATSAVFLGSAASAGPYTAQKNRACPEVWEDTKRAIPVVHDSNTSWANDNDEAEGLAHISSKMGIETIDAVPVTPQHKVGDALTVASECLAYRNLEVDSLEYVPPVIAVDTSLGWLPAAIY